jgi:hypothetical protein
MRISAPPTNAPAARPLLTDDAFHGADQIPLVDPQGHTVAVLDFSSLFQGPPQKHKPARD